MKLILLAIFLALPSYSSAFDLKENSLSIGYGSLIFGSHRTETSVDRHEGSTALTLLPHIYYKKNNLELNGIEGLYRFKISEKINLGPFIRYGGDLYRGPGIPERRLSPFVGFYVDRDSFRFNINHGATNPAVQGFYAQLSYRNEFQINNRIKVGYLAEAEYMSADYTTYYFGVRSNETSVFPFYESDNGSLNMSVLGKLHAKLIWNFELHLSAGLKVLGSGANSAPTVEKDVYFLGSAVLAYKLW